MKVIRSTIVLVAGVVLFAAFANAQSRFDLYFGMGTARDASTNQLVVLSDGTQGTTGKIDGLFGTIGGGLMLTPSLGVGANVSFRFAQGEYAGYGTRPIFYDFNGIWTPSLGTKRVLPEIQAGFGGVNLRFYGGTPYYDYYSGRYTDFAGSSNHFQLHGGFGLRAYLTPHVFIRPQIDLHLVPNLNNEFKSNLVKAYAIAIGYSTGG